MARRHQDLQGAPGQQRNALSFTHSLQLPLCPAAQQTVLDLLHVMILAVGRQRTWRLTVFATPIALLVSTHF